jgi:hypothetical protein
MFIPTNIDRANRVRQFIIDYAAKHADVDDPLDTTATYVITDILHLVNLEGRSPSEVWESAYYIHYAAEVEEENQ